MTFGALWHPYSLIFLASFLLALAIPHFQSRRRMMAVKFASDSLIAAYIFLLGGYSGACGAMIAGLGAGIQALTPPNRLEATFRLRLGVALLLCAASVYFVYKTPLDLIPIAMVVTCRLGEIQKDPQRIRLLYFCTNFPWLVYHGVNGFYLPFCSQIFSAISLFIGLVNHRSKSRSEAIQCDAP